VIEAISEGRSDHRDRRRQTAHDRSHLIEILRTGNAQARAVADTTFSDAYRAISMDY
jgi:hypothetical protein